MSQAGERWPALERPAWRPDIRAAVISKTGATCTARCLKMAEFTGLLPPAVLPGCVVYPAPSQRRLDFLPCAESGKPIPGVLRPGPMPGLAKLEVLALIILTHRTVTCVLASAWSGGLALRDHDYRDGLAPHGLVTRCPSERRRAGAGPLFERGPDAAARDPPPSC